MACNTALFTTESVCVCVCVCVCVVIGEYNLEFYFGSTVGAGRIMIQVGS